MSSEDLRYVDSSTREELWRFKYQQAVERFSSGKEGEATFRAVLIGLGFRGQELAAEIALAKMAK